MNRPDNIEAYISSVYIAKIPGKGRGVFAGQRFSSGALIERVPLIVLSAAEVERINDTILSVYTYAWGPEREAALLGYGMIYNHSYRPNAVYVRNMEACVIDYIALRDIEVDEEITVNYGGSPDAKDPVWFEVME